METKGINLIAKINNINLSYTYHGPEGTPAIIFIHGFPFNKSMWDAQVEAFKEKYRVITYDVRGHGQSEMGNEEFSIDLFAKDLIALMDFLEIEKASLCGLSMGGYIALNAVQNYPGRFEALILSDTQCYADSPEAKEKRLKAIENIREKGVENYAEESLKNLFVPGSFTNKPEAVSAIKSMITNTPTQTLYHTLHALMNRQETCSRLGEIKIPVLVLVGKEDKLIPPAASQYMNERVPGSSYSEIEGAGHVANMENPEGFNGELKGFLESRGL